MNPENLRNARIDVEAAIEAWTKIFNEYLENLDFVYIKGSATKYWQSPMDYVPVLSDLDFHVKTVNDKPLFPSTKSGFMSSLEISSLYERIFRELRPSFLHIPRPQIVTMDELDPTWIPYNANEMRVIYGEVNIGKRKQPEDVREEDYNSLKELGSVLASLPMMLLDRIGLEYYRVIRSICWRVSPSPFRLLSQTEDPDYIWGLNRTQLKIELENAGYMDTAKHYKDYYLSGWRMFETEFKDNTTMRDCIKNGFLVLDSVFNHLKKIRR
jgi:hypothetical protein